MAFFFNKPSDTFFQDFERYILHLNDIFFIFLATRAQNAVFQLQLRIMFI